MLVQPYVISRVTIVFLAKDENQGWLFVNHEASRPSVIFIIGHAAIEPLIIL